jgi:hypothetical protein
MHVADVLTVCVLGVGLVLMCGVLARQRYMLRAPGALPVAIRRGAARWTYGIARFAGDELRWYRGWGMGTRPTLSLRRPDLTIVGHRAPVAAGELKSLPATARIVECRSQDGRVTVLAFSESAFTGFVSWLEAAPRS